MRINFLQAKFLKACGTLHETPAEIRTCSVKCKDLSAPVEEVEPLKFHSWPSDATFQKLISNLQPDQLTPIRTDGVNKQSGSLVHTPSRWNSNLKNMARELRLSDTLKHY